MEVRGVAILAMLAVVGAVPLFPEPVAAPSDSVAVGQGLVQHKDSDMLWNFTNWLKEKFYGAPEYQHTENSEADSHRLFRKSADDPTVTTAIPDPATVQTPLAAPATSNNQLVQHKDSDVLSTLTNWFKEKVYGVPEYQHTSDVEAETHRLTRKEETSAAPASAAPPTSPMPADAPPQATATVQAPSQVTITALQATPQASTATLQTEPAANALTPSAPVTVVAPVKAAQAPSAPTTAPSVVPTAVGPVSVPAVTAIPDQPSGIMPVAELPPVTNA